MKFDFSWLALVLCISCGSENYFVQDEPSEILSDMGSDVSLIESEPRKGKGLVCGAHAECERGLICERNLCRELTFCLAPWTIPESFGMVGCITTWNRGVFTAFECEDDTHCEDSPHGPICINGACHDTNRCDSNEDCSDNKVCFLKTACLSCEDGGLYADECQK